MAEGQQDLALREFADCSARLSRQRGWRATNAVRMGSVCDAGGLPAWLLFRKQGLSVGASARAGEEVRRSLFNNLKNISGWRTREKLVVFAVDDYGNVRLDSSAARDNLIRAGLDLHSRFDQVDALETRQDLEALFEVLSSVSDSRGHPAIFTPYTLCANLDFDAVSAERQLYRYESLPQTFDRLASLQSGSYRGAWDLWQEGIGQRFLKPQFHGREHLNIELFERKLRAGDNVVDLNIAQRSMVAFGGDSAMPGVGFTHAFGVWNKSEVDRHRGIIEDGLGLFESIFGSKSLTFTPPAQKIHPDLYPHLESLGIQGIFKPRWCYRRIDRHDKALEINLVEKQRQHRHLSLVRNVVFEPTQSDSYDSVKIALDQVAAAFRWRRPAMISSHRVNFSGHIDEANRTHGLAALRRLLSGIVDRWPDVQFISADELAKRIAPSQNG